MFKNKKPLSINEQIKRKKLKFLSYLIIFAVILAINVNLLRIASASSNKPTAKNTDHVVKRVKTKKKADQNDLYVSPEEQTMTVRAIVLKRENQTILQQLAAQQKAQAQKAAAQATASSSTAQKSAQTASSSSTTASNKTTTDNSQESSSSSTSASTSTTTTSGINFDNMHISIGSTFYGSGEVPADGYAHPWSELANYYLIEGRSIINGTYASNLLMPNLNDGSAVVINDKTYHVYTIIDLTRSDSNSLQTIENQMNNTGIIGIQSCLDESGSRVRVWFLH